MRPQCRGALPFRHLLAEGGAVAFDFVLSVILGPEQAPGAPFKPAVGLSGDFAGCPILAVVARVGLLLLTLF